MKTLVEIKKLRKYCITTGHAAKEKSVHGLACMSSIKMNSTEQ
jgi:hypothetical protein